MAYVIFACIGAISLAYLDHEILGLFLAVFILESKPADHRLDNRECCCTIDKE